MNENEPGNAVLVDYLLGRLPEAEQERLERAYLGDSVLQEQLLLAESELIEAYARGDLTATERQHLERGTLASARGRRQLALVRDLVAVASSASGRRRRWPMVAGVVAAAAAVVALWLVRRESPVVASLELAPGVTRSLEVLPVLSVAARTSRIRLQLDLPADHHPSYRVTLLDPGGEARWTAGTVTSVPAGAGRALVVEVPAAVLDRGGQSVVVSADDDRDRPLASYAFTVRRP